MLRVHKSAWSLRRNCHGANPEIRCLAYKTIRPISEYAKTVSDPYTVANSRKLRAQRLTAILLFNKFSTFYSPSELCKRTNLPSLELPTKQERLKLLRQIIYKLIKLNSYNCFEISANGQSRHRNRSFLVTLFSKMGNDCS